jgi:hypothetical protein
MILTLVVVVRVMVNVHDPEMNDDAAANFNEFRPPLSWTGTTRCCSTRPLTAPIRRPTL